MGQKRRNFSSSFKSKVVLEALKEREPLSQLASRYGIHANQITKWKNRHQNQIRFGVVISHTFPCMEVNLLSSHYGLVQPVRPQLGVVE